MDNVTFSKLARSKALDGTPTWVCPNGMLGLMTPATYVVQRVLMGGVDNDNHKPVYRNISTQTNPIRFEISKEQVLTSPPLPKGRKRYRCQSVADPNNMASGIITSEPAPPPAEEAPNSSSSPSSNSPGPTPTTVSNTSDKAGPK
jgi:hypothetical protein